jgi:tripartite-type tricarboxylate transporter receptor subunit TctC
MLRRRSIAGSGLAAALVCLFACTDATRVAAQAQDWPTRPVTWIVPFAAGGPGDTVARALAPRLGEALGQTIIIENVGGAGGSTALNRVAKAAPDGYQFGTGNSGTHTFSQILNSAPPYDAVADFAPISMITEGGYALIARNDLPANTLPEFIAYTRANQAKMQYGSAGTGSGTHVVCALLNMTIGVNVTHVPYRATNLATQDMMAGRIDYLCDAIATARPQIDGKTVKAIALLSAPRSPVLPNVPTAQEQGLANFNESSWNALFFPKNTPDAIVQRMNAAVATTLDTPAVRIQLDRLGLNAAPPERRGPAFLAKFVADEIPRWMPVLKSAAVPADK